MLFERQREKIKYYKELCKAVIQQKNKFLDKIEIINNILFSNKLTSDNLNQHKKLIQDLLGIIQEKREEIYLLKSNIEILEKDLRIWVYDFDCLKLTPDIKNRLLSINTQKLAQNINDEIAHKSVTKEEKSALINADRFLMISGQRGYFFEQKIFFQQEVERLNEMFKKNYYKRMKWKTKYAELNNDLILTKTRLEKEVEFYREKLIFQKANVDVQTDIDFYEFNKMLMNHEMVKYSKRFIHNKLSDSLDRIKYGCSKFQPIAKKSLLNLIPEIYNEKIDHDNKMDLDNKRRMEIEDFLYTFMEDKFKLKKFVKKHCEETIISIIKYSDEDKRIDLIGRFLGLNNERIRREILDLYLILIKSIPMSFFRLFEDDYLDYTMDSLTVFEIYLTKFELFKFVLDNKYEIMRNTLVYENKKEIKMNDDVKLDQFLMWKFYGKSFVLINDLISKYKDGKMNEISLEVLYEKFYLVNKEFDINYFEFCQIAKRVFNHKNEDTLDLQSFFNFFNKVKSFKIKIVDFIEITLNNIISLFNMIEKKIFTFFDESDSSKEGIVYFKQFREIMIKVLNNEDNKWKIIDYFNNAMEGSEKQFITREEFYSFCMNNKDIFLIYFSLVKNKS